MFQAHLENYEQSNSREAASVSLANGCTERLNRVRTFLARGNFQGFTHQELFIPAWHSIAALSNMAESITNLHLKGQLDIDEAVSLLKEIVRRAVHPKVNPFRRKLEGVRNLYKWGYYLEHLNICLGALSRLTIDHEYTALNRRVSEHLRHNTLKYDNYHADLHARSRMKWPADQAAILYSLWLYDQNYGTNLSDEPIRGWFEYMNSHAVHPETGLYITEVVGVKKFSGIPRGCALSYLSHYVGRFDLTAASDIWEQYKNHFLTTTVIGTGFREYPIDYKYQWTPDSGPIVLGLGAAATGIGLNAASTIGDRDTFVAIENNLSRIQSWFGVIEKIIGNNLITRVATDLLATSIRLNAETKCAWY
jgi:hypothetical protein